ncbi:hypothetical protein [Dyella sp. A6]|uniref:hypothetical protein n=1 Tax=Dyella aluminiiresistens TaxID=3069105 RepID=UPI002E7A4EE1|nr:hypothetical protein [Dyella sp. A6]
MRFVLLPTRRPRHPLARALSLLLGLALVGILLVFGLMVAGVLLVGGGLLLAWRHWRHGRAPISSTTGPTPSAHRPDLLEGEFVVIRQGRPAAH